MKKVKERFTLHLLTMRKHLIQSIIASYGIFFRKWGSTKPCIQMSRHENDRIIRYMIFFNGPVGVKQWALDYRLIFPMHINIVADYIQDHSKQGVQMT